MGQLRKNSEKSHIPQLSVKTVVKINLLRDMEAEHLIMMMDSHVVLLLFPYTSKLYTLYQIDLKQKGKQLLFTLEAQRGQKLQDKVYETVNQNKEILTCKTKAKNSFFFFFPSVFFFYFFFYLGPESSMAKESKECSSSSSSMVVPNKLDRSFPSSSCFDAVVGREDILLALA